MSVCAAPTCSHQSFDGSSYYVDVDVEYLRQTTMLLAALSAGTNTKDSFNLCLILENNRLFDWLGIKDLYSNPWV